MLNAVGLDSSDGSILPRLSGNFQDCMLWKLSVCLLLSKSFSKSFIRGSNETDDLVNNQRYKNKAKLQLQPLHRAIHKSSVTLSRSLLPQTTAIKSHLLSFSLPQQTP